MMFNDHKGCIIMRKCFGDDEKTFQFKMSWFKLKEKHSLYNMIIKSKHYNF